MTKVFIILSAVFSLLFTSCKKDDEQPRVEVNVQNLAGTYKLSKIDVSVNGSERSDVTRFLLKACQKDDLLVLQPDMTCSYVDAGVSCGSGNIDGEWSLADNNVIVIADSTYSIQKFDGTNMELTHTEIVNRVSATYTEYYGKQQ